MPEQEIVNLDQQVATAASDAAADQANLRTAREQLAHGSNGEDVGQEVLVKAIEALPATGPIAHPPANDAPSTPGAGEIGIES